MSKKWNEAERALDRQANFWKSIADDFAALPKIPWSRSGWKIRNALEIVDDDSWRKGIDV